MTIMIRTGRKTDVSFLRRMLYEAAYWRKGNRPGIKKGLSVPELSKLLANWGRDGDLAVIAELEEQPVGAAWIRYWSDADHSFGYVASEVPELGIGVLPDYRNMGIGRKLMERLTADAARLGIGQVSLSVERDNPALHLYESLGFKTVSTCGNAFTMVISTNAA